MSFLAGRLAGKEAAYFFEESKNAVTRLASKNPNKSPIHKNPNSQIANPNSQIENSTDVLPEILRHSLPAKFYRQQPLADSPSSPGFSDPKWALRDSGSRVSGVSPDVLNPLRGYVSLPQVTFGPRRWQLPSAESSVVASTANDLRHEHHTHVNPEKVRAAAEGLTHIGMAFAAATAIIFGSAALTFGLAASKLDIQSLDDIRARVKDIMHPKFETMKEGLQPLRDWAGKKSEKWHFKNEHDIKDRPVIKELSKVLGTKS